jgi:hypothetical protein
MGCDLLIAGSRSTPLRVAPASVLWCDPACSTSAGRRTGVRRLAQIAIRRRFEPGSIRPASFALVRTATKLFALARGAPQILREAKPRVTSVNVVEKAAGHEVAMAQAALGGSWSVSLVGGGLSISPMASTPM